MPFPVPRLAPCPGTAPLPEAESLPEEEPSTSPARGPRLSAPTRGPGRYLQQDSLIPVLYLPFALPASDSVACREPAADDEDQTKTRRNVWLWGCSADPPRRPRCVQDADQGRNEGPQRDRSARVGHKLSAIR